jgi:hypothetical protein
MKSQLKIFVGLFLIMFISFSCDKKRSQIHYMNLYTTTVISISCHDLTNSTQTELRVLSEIENKQVFALISRLKPADSDWNIDARINGFLYNNSKKIDFCMSTTIFEMGGKKYFVNDNMREYMIELTKK